MKRDMPCQSRLDAPGTLNHVMIGRVEAGREEAEGFASPGRDCMDFERRIWGSDG